MATYTAESARLVGDQVRWQEFPLPYGGKRDFLIATLAARVAVSESKLFGGKPIVVIIIRRSWWNGPKVVWKSWEA